MISYFLTQKSHSAVDTNTNTMNTRRTPPSVCLSVAFRAPLKRTQTWPTKRGFLHPGGWWCLPPEPPRIPYHSIVRNEHPAGNFDCLRLRARYQLCKQVLSACSETKGLQQQVFAKVGGKKTKGKVICWSVDGEEFLFFWFVPIFYVTNLAMLKPTGDTIQLHSFTFGWRLVAVGLPGLLSIQTVKVSQQKGVW